jgi:hypothetical protein
MPANLQLQVEDQQMLTWFRSARGVSAADRLIAKGNRLELRGNLVAA